MSNSVVSAAAAAQAKQLIRNKKLTKRADDQRPAHDEQQANGKDDDKANAIQTKHAEHSGSMSDSISTSEFSFANALSSASDSSSFTLQADGGSSGGDGGSGGSGTLLAIGAVGLVGAGVAVLAGGGGGDKNEAPTITSAATATVAENAAASTVVYQAVATDPNGDALTYSLSGTDAALFNISATGAVTQKASANFEAKASYSFTVVASDGELSDDQAVALTVTNVNEAPTITSAATATVAENAATSTVVYQVVATDPDAGAVLTYSLSGADAALFDISATGAVTLKTAADFETKPVYNFTVVASDGTLSDDQVVTLSVTDNPLEGPTFTSAATAAPIAENVPTSTVVYDADATGLGAIVFGLTGADAALFNINAQSGVVTFKNSPDFETKSSYDISVTATDTLGTTTKALPITITDVNPEAVTAAITVSAAGSNTDADNVATTYTVSNPGGGAANYEYTITGFDLDDKIVGPAGAQISVINNDFADGEVIVQYFANNQNAQIVLEGLTAQQDGSIISLTTLNNIFGAGSIA